MEGRQAVIVGIVTALTVLGAVALVAGIVQVARSRRLARSCTAEALGTVVDMVDHASGRLGGVGRGARGREEKVEAANEAIAAKKRAYQAKKRECARRAADEPLATWSVVVSWMPEGAAGDFGGSTACGGNAGRVAGSAGRAAGAAGGERRLEGSRRHRHARFKVGQQVHVCYDPADPGCAYLHEEGLSRGLGLTLIGCGGALVALAVICWFLLPGLSTSYGG